MLALKAANDHISQNTSPNDAANRRIRSDYFTSSASTPSKSVTFSYDTAGRLSGYDDGVTSAVYSYDVMGRRTSETINYGAFSKTFSTAYYKNGRKKGFTTPENTTYSYSYDAANRLAAVTLPGQGTISFNAYQWQSPTSVQYPGGGVRKTEYDALMRPVHITSQDPAANATLDQQYTYDISGNLTQKITKQGAYTYGYDVLDRLTSAKNPTMADETYTYDVTGNRLTAANTTGNWQYNNNNQLLNDTLNAYDYDANGSQIKQTNTASSEVREYIYNLENRTSTFKVNGTVISNYYYDPFGRRLWKEVNGARVYALYSQEGLIAEYDSAGVLKQNYGYIPQSTWGTQPLFTVNASTTGYYQLDQLGTPQELTTTSGAVVWSAQYQAFGRASVTENGLSSGLRFPGQLEDGETGLNYNLFRSYNSGMGRYIRNDPIGLNAGLNTYNYVYQNPQSWIDPLGLQAVLNCSRCKENIYGSLACEIVQDENTTGYGIFNTGYNKHSLQGKSDPYGNNGPLPPGKYDIKLAYSRKFKRILPSPTNIGRPGEVITPKNNHRTGIRIHAGHISEGCITTGKGASGRNAEKYLYDLVDAHQDNGGTIMIITEVKCD